MAEGIARFVIAPCSRPVRYDRSLGVHFRLVLIDNLSHPPLTTRRPE
jgi:hypothetical protein